MPVITQCDYCKKKVKRKPSSILSHVFCSKKCSSKDLIRRTHNSRKTICKQCSKTFYPCKRRNRKDQLFCDQKCMGAFNATLDYSVSHLSEEVLESIDGFMLGDGHISPDSSHLTWSLKYEHFSEYIAHCFSHYDPTCNLYFVKDKRFKKGGVWSYSGRTKSHPDLAKQRARWYCNKKKAIPEDVAISPKSVLLWYLGDGCLNGVNVIFSTDSFNKTELEILLSKLKQIGVVAKIQNKRNRIIIQLSYIRSFFDYIGWHSPIRCYDYKFDMPSEIKHCLSTSELSNKLSVCHYTIYSHGKRLFANKSKLTNNSFWWNKNEQIEIAKAISSQQGK